MIYQLSERTNALRDTLVSRAERLDETSLLSLMGYPSPSDRDHKRLRHVLTDPMLGVFHWPFPFTTRGTDFLRLLGAALSLDLAQLNQAIADIERAAAEASDRFIPHIFVETHFRRTTQPIFALAACEPQRYITPDDETLQLWFFGDQTKRLDLISEQVRNHYTEHQGQLGIWGPISHYILTYAADKALTIHPDGRIGAEAQMPSPARAALLYRNRPISL